jgi:hypothetical protein
MTPWDMRDWAKRPYDLLESGVQTLMTSHLGPYLGVPRKERIQVSSWKHQQVIKAVLNKAAKSTAHPFSGLGIQIDDWRSWDGLYARVGHKLAFEIGLDATKRSVIGAIRKCIDAADQYGQLTDRHCTPGSLSELSSFQSTEECEYCREFLGSHHSRESTPDHG